MKLAARASSWNHVMSFLPATPDRVSQAQGAGVRVAWSDAGRQRDFLITPTSGVRPTMVRGGVAWDGVPRRRGLDEEVLGHKLCVGVVCGNCTTAGASVGRAQDGDSRGGAARARVNEHARDRRTGRLAGAAQFS